MYFCAINIKFFVDYYLCLLLHNVKCERMAKEIIFQRTGVFMIPKPHPGHFNFSFLILLAMYLSYFFPDVKIFFYPQCQNSDIKIANLNEYFAKKM